MATSPPPRQQRYSDAERKQIAQNRQRANAGAKYGQGYYDQGYRNQKEAGQSFLHQQDYKLKHGAFAPLSWDMKWDANGNLIGVRPKANQTDRIKELGGRDWQDPSKVLKAGQWAAIQRTTGNSAIANKRNAWRAANPGAGRDQFLYDKYVGGLKTDPTTGLKVNRYGDTYDPNRRFTTEDLGTGAVRQGTAPRFGANGAQGIAVGEPAPGGGLKMGGRGRNGNASLQTQGQGIEGSLQQGLNDLLKSEGPFNDQVVQNLRSQAKMDAYAPVEGQIRQANDSAVQRGLFRSGIPVDQERQIRESAGQTYSQATTQIENNAVLQNHQARLQALDRAQKWLDSKRQWILANETNALNRELGLKQIALGYARIQSEQASLDKQLAQSNYQFNQMNPNLQFTDPTTGEVISLPPGMLKYLDYFTG